MSCWGDGRERSLCSGLTECLCNVLQAGSNEIVRGGTWHRSMVGEPNDSVGDAFAIGFGNVCMDAMVHIHGRANVPPWHSMCVPRTALVGFLMYQNLDARGHKGHEVVVIVSIDLFIG